MHSRGFNRMLHWLEAADEDNEASLKLGAKVLETLRKLPITVKALQDCDAGRSVIHFSSSHVSSFLYPGIQMSRRLGVSRTP